jgi:hypothetical protein
MDREALISERFARMQGSLSERGRRLFAATEALSIGWGGVATVARATGLAPSTIGAGKAEVRALEMSDAPPLPAARGCRAGADARS